MQFGKWLLCDFLKVLRVSLKVVVTDKANYWEISVVLFVGVAAKWVLWNQEVFPVIWRLLDWCKNIMTSICWVFEIISTFRDISVLLSVWVIPLQIAQKKRKSRPCVLNFQIYCARSESEQTNKLSWCFKPLCRLFFRDVIYKISHNLVRFVRRICFERSVSGMV